MKKILLFLVITLSFMSTLRASDCQYWLAKVDPKVPDVNSGMDETTEQNIITGIECLLKAQGNKRNGVLYGGKPEVSQRVPRATVEVNALYRISELFYGNDDFASAVALVGKPAKVYGDYGKILFNSDSDVKKAFESYRIWFEKVKKIGIEEARKQKLDPLQDSGVQWY